MARVSPNGCFEGVKGRKKRRRGKVGHKGAPAVTKGTGQMQGGPGGSPPASGAAPVPCCPLGSQASGVKGMIAGEAGRAIETPL